MAVIGLKLEIIGIDWRMALAKNTMLDSLKNWMRIDLGTKVIRVYLDVSI